MAHPTEALVATLRGAGCVFAEEEARILSDATDDPAHLATLVARRVAGEPLEVVVGWADFAGVRVRVDPGVFVPRQRTALLVDLAAEALPAGGVLVDLCCGSGALGLAIAVRRTDVQVHAADIDPVAVACARRNLEPVGGTARAGDLDAPLPEHLRGTVDVLVANGPYVPTAAITLMPPESRNHEPRGTLDGGADGLDVVRRLAACAPGWLAPGGTLLVEVGDDQEAAALAAFEAAGLRSRVHGDVERGATAISGRLGSAVPTTPPEQPASP